MTARLLSAVPRVRGRLDASEDFEPFDLAHDSVISTPARPGLIAGSSEGGSWILVSDVRRWITTNRAELIASSDKVRPLLWWSSPAPARLEALYRAARGQRVALRQARPTRITEVRRAPAVWGLYRIHQGTGAWYVGISSNLRNRLYAHQAQGRLDFTRGDTVDLIQAKQPGVDGVVTWADLQDAERVHIQRLRKRGERLVNVVSGGNGNPPAVRFYGGELDKGMPLGGPLTARPPEDDWYWVRVGDLDGDGEISNGRPVQAFDLRTGMSKRSGEWLLSLAQDAGLQVWAQPHRSDAASMFRQAEIELAQLRALAVVHGEETRLERALEEAEGAATQSLSLPLLYWIPRSGRRTDRSGRLIPAQALLELTRTHVVEGVLPAGVRAAGYEFDDQYRRDASLNHVRRIRASDGSLIYVKVEENSAAARAELLASLIWYRTGWAGIVDRVVESSDGSVLIIPPVAGVRSIVDQGAFPSAFPHAGRESPETLRVGKRAPYVMRLGIEELRLRDPYDVVRFVVLNAAWGNSDRHARNLHYGWEEDDDSAAGGYGYLLPLDHGRCFFNNFPLATQGQIHGSPAAAVTGKLGNPHQLLRAFADLAIADPEPVRYVVEKWCQLVANILESLISDAEWIDLRAELTAMAGRLEKISSSPVAFMDSCVKVVVR